jgi:hypothetical protein
MGKRSRKSIRSTVAYATAFRAPDPVPVPVPVPMAVPAPVPVLPAEDLLSLPHPDDLAVADPDAPAAPPGLVPPGNSRSLRRGDEFALVYLHDSSLVSGTGTVGRAGHWRVVSYPSRAAAAHAYACACSRLHADGFIDYAPDATRAPAT